VTGSAIACALLLGDASVPDADAFRAVGFALLGTPMTLAVLEHWFVVLPLRFEAPSRWVNASNRGPFRPCAL
jgi:putative photosynthetic complex assembly protein 2